MSALGGGGDNGGERTPTLAVLKLASCDGCQLSLLDCEDDLLTLTSAVRVAHFVELTSTRIKGPYDLALVEGSVTTIEDRQRLETLRDASRILVTIGACATAGGIQGLVNLAGQGAFATVVYPHPELLSTLWHSSPVADIVPVDHELHGCPVDRGQLLEVLSALLVGRRPILPGHSVCEECKRQGTTCLLVEKGVACLGPVTRAGCGALCPGIGRGCFGCFGPSESPSTTALARRLAALGTSEVDLFRLFATFNANAPAFLTEGRAHVAPSPPR